MLHGARSYLLQDADGQVLEAHSISAGLDYPGVGPEHSWLQEIGPRAVCLRHRRRGAGRVPALAQARRHHSGARIRPRHRPCHARSRRKMPQGPDHRASVCPAAATRTCSPSPTRWEQKHMSRIAGTLRRIARGQPRRLHAVHHRGRSRRGNLVRHSARSCPKPAPISSSSACRSPIPWPTARRSRPRRMRALKARHDAERTLELVRALPRPRHATRRSC